LAQSSFFFALVYSARSTRAAINANKLNRAAYVTGQRPWITIKPSLAGDLILYEDVAILTVRIEVRNAGKAPATDIAIDIRLVDTGNRWMFDEIEEFAAFSIIVRNQDLGNHQGTSLFPNETLAVKREINTGTKRERIQLAERPCVALSLIASVTYAFEFQEREPITAVAYRLFRTDQPDELHVGAFVLDEGKIPADALRLEPSFGSLIR
jgi:hypothetical protein